MVKGKPWTLEQEQQLQKLVKAKVPISRIAMDLGMSYDSVRAKIRRLGLEEEDPWIFSSPSSSCELPTELLTVEQSLMILAKAMKTLEQENLDKTEVLRLRSLVQASKIYQEKFGEYADYLRIEKELTELRKEVADLRKNAEENAPRRD